MAFVHEQSCECMKGELDLFAVSPTQTSIEHGTWIEYHPLSTITDGAPIEFDVNGTGEEYMDIANNYLQVKAKIVKEDGTDIAAAGTVRPVNNFLHRLFFAGGRIFERHSDHFIYCNLSLSSLHRKPNELWAGDQRITVDVGCVLQGHGSTYGYCQPACR
jgi:hypothetical protein